jgi:DNA polymerase V
MFVNNPKKQRTSGFPSPAEDFSGPSLDLNQRLMPHPASTFLMRVSSKQYQTMGINKEDILIVDRSLLPRPGKTIVAIVDGAMCLLPLSSHHKLNLQTELWGVVTYVIRKL